VSDAVADAPGPGSGGDGFIPLAKKHVVIRNVVQNRQTLNVHCKSSDDDLGLIHIPFGNSWGFRFRVNIWETTRFRCHFTWYFGGSHYFDIFSTWRVERLQFVKNVFGRWEETTKTRLCVV
ncbi:unnamed protein product, partial [Brassica oleracea var. botrytis]